MKIFYSGTGSTNFVETHQKGINIMMTFYDMQKGPTKRYKAICLARKKSKKRKRRRATKS